MENIYLRNFDSKSFKHMTSCRSGCFSKNAIRLLHTT